MPVACSKALIDSVEREIVADARPNLTFIFDLDPVVGLARAKARGEGADDRFERKGLSFHQKLRSGFLEIAQQDATRCRVIDASKNIEDVAAQIWGQINGR